uniref:Coiled-coil domain-containing protein 171-like n=1 Tax=Phallusia mammillata TaxID=59560 RepID=A0A6F9D7S8_9ASCI|nr:coiled-coil domain-containing protein 171-like [Phallusia mammillata]
MDEYRRLNTVSKTPSSASLNENFPGEATILITKLQQQLQTVRSDNDDFARKASELHKRIHHLEEEKVSVASNFNKENASLQAQVARLQSQVERAEATKQTLEYDLAVAKKKTNDVTRSTTHKEVTMAKANIELADAKSSLELHLGELENELAVARQVTAENEKRIAFLEEDKKQLHSDAMATEAILRGEKEALSNQVIELKQKSEIMEQGLEDAKTGLIKQEEELRKTVAELQIALEREQHLRHEYEDLSHRARSLEESVEAERAAHLESKFNSEIIQLKQQEFQSQLTRERDVCEVLKSEAEEANKRAVELEKALNFERHQAKNANVKLDKTVEVYSDVRKRLDEELAEKTKLIEVMTKQLEEHQNHLNLLKEELGKTRKRQVFLEETYGGNVRELELLLETFTLEPVKEAKHKSKEKEKEKKKKDRRHTAEQSKHALEEMRKMLFAYQKTIGDYEHKIENLVAAEKQTQKDCDNFRDLALTRERTLQQVQSDLAQCGEEMEKIRTQQAEYEREAGKACHDLGDVTQELQQQTERCRQLEQNLNSIQDRHNTELEVHVSFLRELHHVVCCASGEKNLLTRFTWPDLSVTVREGVDALVSMYNRSKEKVGQLESSCQEMEKSITDLQRAHESSVDRLAERCRDREEDSVRQRKRLEQHYEALMAEINARAKKTQGLCDEAWERLRAKDGVHDGLHAECSQLRGENGNLKQECKALSCACAILLGALYPILRAREDLALQRHLLERITSDGEVCKQQMRELVDTLNDEMAKPDETKQPSIAHCSFRAVHPLIRFRVAVISVLAANRLQMLSQHANVSMFTCDDSAMSNSRIVVVAGRGETRTPPKRNKGEVSVTSRSDSAVQWLSDQQVVHAVREATCGVVEAVAKNKGDTSGYMSRAVVKTAKNAFVKLLDNTQHRFGSYTTANKNIIRDRRSLCRVLGDGLEKVIHKARLRESINLFSVEYSFSALRRHLLTFTERLHAAEVEKRKLRNVETKLKGEIEQLNKSKMELTESNMEMQKLKDKERHLVSRSRFEGVCSELKSAMERERRAQKLLHEQNAQLQDLSSKLEEECTDGVEKEVTLNQAVTSLTEVKMELKRSSQTKRQLEKQVDRLHKEREKLKADVEEAKNALKLAAGEKSSIAKYFETVEKSMRSADAQEISSKLRIQAEELTDQSGPGMKAAQRAVESFMRAQSSAVTRISSLEEQISSYRTHISDLKRELYDACHRENDNGIDLELSHVPTRDSGSPALTKSRASTRHAPLTPLNDSDFRPMRGEVIDENSMNLSNGYTRPRPRFSDPRRKTSA